MSSHLWVRQKMRLPCSALPKEKIWNKTLEIQRHLVGLLRYAWINIDLISVYFCSSSKFIVANMLNFGLGFFINFLRIWYTGYNDYWNSAIEWKCILFRQWVWMITWLLIYSNWTCLARARGNHHVWEVFLLMLMLKQETIVTLTVWMMQFMIWIPWIWLKVCKKRCICQIWRWGNVSMNSLSLQDSISWTHCQRRFLNW